MYEYYEVLTMDWLKKFVICVVMAILCIMAGCVSEPDIQSPSTYVKIKSSFSDDLKTTNLDVKVMVNNPNPIGVHINEIRFDVYLLGNNGEKVILEQNEKYDIDIEGSGTTPIEFQMSIPNDKIMSAIKNSKDGKITIGVDGYALVDVEIDEIEIPIKGETEISIPDIKSPQTNVNIEVSPGIPTTKIDAKITINNPNNVGVNIKEFVADVYYMDNNGNFVEQIKHMEKQMYIKENDKTTVEIPITIGVDDLPSPDYIVENGGNIIIGIEGHAIVDAKIKEIKVPFSGKTTIKSPFQSLDNSPLPTPPNPPQPPQLPDTSDITPPLPQPPQLPDPSKVLNELISSINANGEYSQYYIGIIENDDIPDTIYAQTIYCIIIMDSNGNLVCGADVYIDEYYQGTTDEYGRLPYIFHESGYHTIRAEYNGEVLASNTIYVE